MRNTLAAVALTAPAHRSFPASKQANIAQHNQQNSAYLATHLAMAKINNTFNNWWPRPPKLRLSPRSRRIQRQESAGTVSPGRVISKAERSSRQSSRNDSAISSLDGPTDKELDAAWEEWEAHDRALGTLGHRIVEWLHHLFFQSLTDTLPWLRRWCRQIDEHYAPEVCVATLDRLRDDRKAWRSLRALLLMSILVLTVFGSLYSLVEYLLLVTRASACNTTSISTVFIPITETITAGMTSLSSSALVSPASGNNTSVASALPYTSTSTQTVTSFVTVGPSTSGSTLPFVYTVDPSGSTVWVNGVSPTSGVSLVTATTSVFITPSLEATDSTPSISTTLTAVPDNEAVSITVPTYTSTEYSFVSPDITTTSTSTSTHFVTYTLTEAQSAPIGSSARSSFPGMASGGWNASTSTTAILMPAAASSVEPEMSTLTSVYFTPASSEQSTSTTTTYLTSTIAVRYTTTIFPSGPSEVGSGYVTTITALPVTIGGYTSSPSLSPAESEAPTSPSPLSSASSTPTSSAVGAITATISSPMSTANPLSSMSTSSSLSSAQSSISTSTLNTTLTFASSMQPSGVSASSQNVTSAIGTAPLSSLSSCSSQVQVNTTGTVPPMATTSSAPSLVPYTMSPISSPVSSSTIAPSNSSSVARGVSASSASSVVSSNCTSVSVQAGSTGKASTLSTGSKGTASLTISYSTNSSTRATSISKTRASLSPAETPPGGVSSASTTSSHTNPVSQYDPTVSSALPTKSGATAPSSSDMTSLAVTTSSSTRGASPSRSGRSSGQSSSSTLNSSTTKRTTAQPRSSTKSSAGTTSSTSTASSGSKNESLTRQPQTMTTTRSVTSSSHTSAHSSSANITSSNPFPAPSATATPSAGCGEHGRFMMDFDDLPNFTPSDENNTDITQAPPILSPYHHLAFSDGYVYAPEPSEPYTPKSSPHLAVFLGNASGIRSKHPDNGDYIKPGEIGDGPRESMSAYWFDAFNAWFGCDNRGPQPCVLVFSAYTWGLATKIEALTFQHNATVPACRRSEDCQLQKVDLPTSFRGLTGLQMQAFVGDEQRMFFMDDLALRWSNNSCAAGLQRQNSQ
ncbi:uncharacterized protein LTR77_006316 [Saxophila tyrrhenica]|uniref:DUF7371 domain-containing protein n=1 Tax=Saxophila tyrrhenica TaxID=1690608 RepID=A0AAV9PBG8_9PEZI|nr:hypothetical protein LTR77_006316 [Saxophila tyrrhenica]